MLQIAVADIFIIPLSPHFDEHSIVIIIILLSYGVLVAKRSLLKDECFQREKLIKQKNVHVYNVIVVNILFT